MLAEGVVVGEAAEEEEVVVARVPAQVLLRRDLAVAAVPRWRVLRLRPGTLLRLEAEHRDRVPVRRGPRRVPSEQGDRGQVPARQDRVRTYRVQVPRREPDPAPDN